MKYLNGSNCYVNERRKKEEVWEWEVNLQAVTSFCFAFLFHSCMYFEIRYYDG